MLFKIISINTNGIRAASRKGFFEWLKSQNADVVCIQETKAQEWQLEDDCFRPEGYFCYYNDALKKGYSGVAIYSRYKPKKTAFRLDYLEIDQPRIALKKGTKISYHDKVIYESENDVIDPVEYGNNDLIVVNYQDEPILKFWSVIS